MKQTHFTKLWGEMSLNSYFGGNITITHGFSSRLHGYASSPEALFTLKEGHLFHSRWSKLVLGSAVHGLLHPGLVVGNDDRT